MNKLALLSSNVYHYVAIYHPMLICTKECFFILDYAVEQRNLERAVINFSLFAYRKLRYISYYKVLLIIFIASERVGMCTDNPRKHVLFCFYFLLYEETSFYWQKDVSVPEGECCCELIMVRTFPIPCQFITPQGFLFKILIKMIFF